MLMNKEVIWSRLFRIDSKAFRSRGGYLFDGRITTDGTSISVYLKRNGSRRRPKRKRTSKTVMREMVQQKYFENHIDEIRRKTNYVVVDPNKRDLLYFRDKHGQHSRYTSNQRAIETCSRKYRKMRERLSKESGVSTLQSTIPTHRTVHVSQYDAYLTSLNELLPTLIPFYERSIHNKLRWNTYVNTQKSEQRLVNKVKERYGDDVAVIMGDWSDGGHTMKFQTSSKTSGWERVFRRNGLAFYLIDEFGTSTFCPRCHSRTETVFKRLSPRPWKRAEGVIVTVHGLLGCKNHVCIEQAISTSPRFQRYWNRDDLSTLNMVDIVENVLVGDGRPTRFCRGRV